MALGPSVLVRLWWRRPAEQQMIITLPFLYESVLAIPLEQATLSFTRYETPQSLATRYSNYTILLKYMEMNSCFYYWCRVQNFSHNSFLKLAVHTYVE